MNNPLILSLYVGLAVPLVAPREVIEALTQVTVTSGSGSADGFELKFNLSNRDTLLQTLFLLSGGAVPPLIRVVIAVTVNGRLDVLMDGIVTQTQVAPDTGAGPTQLVVKGRDISQAMNYVSLTGLFPYPAMPIEGRVALILVKYALLGIVPIIIPTPTVDINNPLERIEYHQGTDLKYLRLLAERVGYVFYVEPGPVVGANIAYWGPLVRVSPPQKALNADMDVETNVEQISCSFDADRATMPILMIQMRETRASIPVPIPAINPLSPPLGIIPPLPKSFPIAADTAKEGWPRALMRGLAVASRSAEAVTAEGTLDVLRYGQPLKPRRYVGLRGVGTAFEGLYYVNKVTSTIQRGEFKQHFSLVRNGLISTVQQVPA
jgi:hypothetical protein